MTLLDDPHGVGDLADRLGVVATKALGAADGAHPLDRRQPGRDGLTASSWRRSSRGPNVRAAETA